MFSFNVTLSFEIEQKSFTTKQIKHYHLRGLQCVHSHDEIFSFLEFQKYFKDVQTNAKKDFLISYLSSSSSSNLLTQIA